MIYNILKIFLLFIVGFVSMFLCAAYSVAEIIKNK
jgi:hypothetical protein